MLKNRIEIINYLINRYGFRSYLEIGVRNTFECFDLIECECKDVVDPGYESEENNVKYKFTSDDFFDLLKKESLDLPGDHTWDLIFIDGLHLSSQVERDIENSLSHLSNGGIIVVHDCNPPTPHHAREEYLDYSTPAGGIWNGTVWKSFYKFRSTRPDLEMCVVDCDWGVGIIKRGNQPLCKIENPYYEYSIFNDNRISSLNLIDPLYFTEWMNNPFYSSFGEKNKKSPRVSICLINMNTLEYTKQCVEDLLEQDIIFNLSVIDQGSSEEGTSEYLKDLFRRHSEGNFFGKINVLGIYNTGFNKPVNKIWNDFVETSDTEFVCLLNNDVRISPNFLSSSILIMDKEERVGFVSHVTNNSKYSQWSEDLDYIIMETPYRQGWDLFFRKDSFHKIPENLIFYFGDDYVFSKLYSSGYKGAYVLNSPMIHLLSSTTPEKGRVDSGFSDRKNFEDLNLEYQHLSFNENICRWYPEFYQISKK